MPLPTRDLTVTDLLAMLGQRHVEVAIRDQYIAELEAEMARLRAAVTGPAEGPDGMG